MIDKLEEYGVQFDDLVRKSQTRSQLNHLVSSRDHGWNKSKRLPGIFSFMDMSFGDAKIPYTSHAADERSASVNNLALEFIKDYKYAIAEKCLPCLDI